MASRGKVFDPQLREETFNIVLRSDVPADIAYVTRKLNEKKRRSTWATTRGILFELVREGRVNMMRTTNNMVFWVEKVQTEKLTATPVAK